MSTPTKNAPARDSTGRGAEFNRRSEGAAFRAPGQAALPDWLLDLLASPPQHGGGVHQWLFKVARHLHAHFAPQEIADRLAVAVAGCGRRVAPGEIIAAVNNSASCAWKPSGGAPRPSGGVATVSVAKTSPKWPEPVSGQIRAIAEADPDALELLRRASPVKISEDHHDADCLLERLFPGDPLLCFAQGVSSAFIIRRSTRDIARNVSHIVPSPMKAKRGLTKVGKPSPRCLDNTGPRYYLITEFDQGDHSTQAAVIRHLATLAPLVMVVDSAGKSLHAWWRCYGQPEARVKTFFKHAVQLGADPATWTRCQLVRMPLGWRHEKDRRQNVLFFDYSAVVKGGAA